MTEFDFALRAQPERTERRAKVMRSFVVSPSLLAGIFVFIGFRVAERIRTFSAVKFLAAPVTVTIQIFGLCLALLVFPDFLFVSGIFNSGPLNSIISSHCPIASARHLCSFATGAAICVCR